MNKFIKLVIGAFLAVILVTSVSADSFTLGGGGASNLKSHDNAVGLSATYGITLTKNTEFRISQGISYADATSSHWSGETLLGGRYYVPISKRFVPFAGVDAGAEYGQVNLGWKAIPSAGVRVFLNDSVFVEGSAGYSFRFTGRTVERGDDVVYKILLGFKF